MKTLATYLFDKVGKNEILIQKQYELIRLLEEKIALLDKKLQEQDEQQGNREGMRVVSSVRD